MPNYSVAIQTQEFLGLIQHQDKLIALYQRLKKMTANKQQLLNKIEYLQFRNKILQQSLFDQQNKLKQKCCAKNQSLIKQVIMLEEDIKRQQQNSNIFRIQEINNQLQQNRQNSRKEDQYMETTALMEKDLNKKQQPKKQRKSSTNRVKNDEVDQMISQIKKMEKIIEKYKKEKIVNTSQLKRLRKVNQEYSHKIKKLERLEDMRSRIISQANHTQQSATISLNSDYPY